MPTRSTPISQELCASLQLAPLSPFAGAAVANSTAHDAFWRLPASERTRREQLLRALPAGASAVGCPLPPILQYEAQQPPLYYVLLAPVYRVLQNEPLPVRVFALRLVSLSIASTIIFTVYRIGLLVLPGPGLALSAALVIAAAPGLFIDICRVGNESLSIALAGALLLGALQVLRRPAHLIHWLLLGLLAGASVLTKSYALAFLPLLPLTAILAFVRTRQSGPRIALGLLLAVSITVVSADWWYQHVWTTTHTLSGEQMDMAGVPSTLHDRLAAARAVDWQMVLDLSAFTHIWTGGWSFLVARAWMYRFFEAAALLAVAGFALHLGRMVRATAADRRLHLRTAGTILVLYLLLAMCAVQAYHSLAAFLATGDSTAIGWYFYAVVAAEATATAIGFHALFGRGWSVRAMTLLVALLATFDLYTMHGLLIPHYTGFLVQSPNGSLPAFHLQRLLDPDTLREIVLRLSYLRALPPSCLAVLSPVYVLSTISLAVLAIRLSLRTRDPMPARLSPESPPTQTRSE